MEDEAGFSLTLGAVAAAVVVLLINHVSIPGMLASSHLSVAKERWGLHARFGWREMSKFDRISALFWIAILSVPLLGLVPRIRGQMLQRDWKGIVLVLLSL